MFKETNENFDYSIFSDERTVQLTSNAHKRWFKPFPDETRLGLIGKHNHLVSFHYIGAISGELQNYSLYGKNLSVSNKNRIRHLNLIF